MCQSMVNIQSPTAEMAREKKQERRRNSMKILWSALLHRATITSCVPLVFAVNFCTGLNKCKCGLPHLWHSSGHHDTFTEVWTVMKQAAWVDFSLVCQLMNEPGHCESLLFYHKGFLINKPDAVRSVCNVVRALHSTVNAWVYNWHFSSFDPQSLWPLCVADADIILSSCGFFYPLSSFFPRLISAVGDWMSTILPHMVWP